MAPAQIDFAELIKSPVLQKQLETAGTMRAEVQRLLNTYFSASYAGTEAERQLALTTETRKLLGQLTRVRALNRDLAHHIRDEKVQTAATRAEIDHLHLQLQNLYYESRHLRGEIDNLRNFQHAYMNLSLRPLTEFLERHAHWVQDGLVDGDGHGQGETELTRARIEEEYQERLALSEQIQTLTRRKQELERTNKRKKEKLDRLDADITKRILHVEAGAPEFENLVADLGRPQAPPTPKADGEEETVT